MRCSNRHYWASLESSNASKFALLAESRSWLCWGKCQSECTLYTWTTCLPTSTCHSCTNAFAEAQSRHKTEFDLSVPETMSPIEKWFHLINVRISIEMYFNVHATRRHTCKMQCQCLRCRTSCPAPSACSTDHPRQLTPTFCSSDRSHQQYPAPASRSLDHPRNSTLTPWRSSFS